LAAFPALPSAFLLLLLSTLRCHRRSTCWMSDVLDVRRLQTVRDSVLASTEGFSHGPNGAGRANQRPARNARARGSDARCREP
jgi:hypothetical protein